MCENRNSYKIILVVRTGNDNDVYFKRDGRRFESEYTLKFQVDTNYHFSASIKPSLPLQSVSVQGNGVSVTDLSQQENNGSKYNFSWCSAKVDHTKKKDRSKVILLLQFQDGLSLSIPLQVKFYKPDDIDHLMWGNALNHIEYDCIVKPGATYVEIVKEIYR